MYVVACSRCQKRLTDHDFTSYAEAQKAARTLGYPAEDAEELWCEDCALSEQREGTHREGVGASGDVSGVNHRHGE